MAPPKPLKEMSDEELTNWSMFLRDMANHQTLMSHMASLEQGVRKVKTKDAPVDISEYT